MTNHTITLTWAEVLIAAQIGIMRQVENLKVGRIDANNLAADQTWQVHVEGALGEAAVAKLLGVYNSGKGVFRGADVGQYQVRTARREGHRLILHPGDLDADIFILAVGQPPAYRIAGWITGGEGKQSHFWTEPVKGRPAFFVPQEALYPIELLPR